MLSKKTWKIIERVAMVVPIAAFILDLVTERIGFAVPVFRFIWVVLGQKVPVFIIVAIIGIVFVGVWLRHNRLTVEETFILSFIDEGERGLEILSRAYKRRFPQESRALSKCCVNIKRLEAKKYVINSAFTGGIDNVQDELFKLTKRGLRKYKKLDPLIITEADKYYSEIRSVASKAKNSAPLGIKEDVKSLKFTEEHGLILTMLGVSSKAVDEERLFDEYKKRFPSKGRLGFKYIMEDLLRVEFIDPGSPYSYGNPYSLTSKGLFFLRKIEEEIQEEELKKKPTKP